MKILIAADSFKDALDASSVCRAIERGLQLAASLPKEAGFGASTVATRIFPLADGGEGLSDILNFHLGLTQIAVEVCDPLFRKTKALYNLSADGKTAFIEMAQAAGLQLLKQEERNPLKTTTFGVGEMINDALKNGAKRIVLGIGGSATNDLGIGMATALGWQFLDKNKDKLLGIGENLTKIETMIPPQYSTLFEATFEVMCDVQNPLLGANGAANVYARQKGASDAAIETLEVGAFNFWKRAKASPKVETEGAGAAGGLGFGALFFLNATIKRGIDAVMDLTNFDEQVAWADVIFTGEGRLDSQTARGKLIAGIVARARKKSVIALCGAVEIPPQYINDLELKAAFSIAQKPCSLQEALVSTAENLEKTAFNIARILLTHENTCV
ncbi:MAG: glycerate kinase [Saprospiraceae bacterium]|nr:glycerate kinase [Saprospiraceae bacterium]